MNRRWWWFVIVVLVAVLLWWWWRERETPPDERLGAEFGQFCDVAFDYVHEPVAGADRVLEVLHKRGPAMLKWLGETLAVLDRYHDERAHRERAIIARERIWGRLFDCREELREFTDAIEADPIARKRLERGGDRLIRSFEIILGPDRLRALL